MNALVLVLVLACPKRSGRPDHPDIVPSPDSTIRPDPSSGVVAFGHPDDASSPTG
jgi:hypothetical protein